ncbi:MAG: HIT family protein [Anaerolineaceae bacterium]
MSGCIFCKIIRGEIPSHRIYEDDLVLSFLDANPINPGHSLVMPKKHYATIFETPQEELHACISACRKVGEAVYRAVGASGLNVLQNNFRSACQFVDHIHFHIIPRRDGDSFLAPWRRESATAAEMEEILKKLKAEL